MKVQRKSTISGKLYVMDLDVTQEQLDRYAEGRELLQNVFPNLRPDEREFIKSGITPEEWNDMFKYDEEE